MGSCGRWPNDVEYRSLVEGRSRTAPTQDGPEFDPHPSNTENLLLLRPFAEFAPGDGHAMYFVGAVGDAQCPAVAPEARDRRVVRNAHRAVHLDRAVEHAHYHVGGHDFDHRDFLPRFALAD